VVIWTQQQHPTMPTKVSFNHCLVVTAKEKWNEWQNQYSQNYRIDE
jgi:hypothetical protein